MNILFSAIDCSPAGRSEQYTAFDILKCASENSNVFLITSAWYQDAFRDEPIENVIPAFVSSELPFHKYLQRIIPIPAIGNIPFNIRAYHVAQQIVARQQIELIHKASPDAIRNATYLSYIDLPLVIGPIGGSLKTPLGFESYIEVNPKEKLVSILRKSDEYKIKYHYLLKNNIEKASAILMQADFVLDAIPDRYHDKCILFANYGVDCSEYTPSLSTQTKSTVDILFVGRLVPFKGIPFLIHAVKILKHECGIGNFRVNIIGDGPMRDEYMKLVKHYDLDMNMIFHGNIRKENIIEYYRDTDIFVFPSIRENYGMAPLEAMSCGKPVIVADYGGMKNTVTNDCGIKVPLYNPKQFIEDLSFALKDLILNVDKRQAMGKRAREHIVANFSQEIKNKKLKDIYERVLISKEQGR
jgi:glycosyltransferase involved in cell wall biosynthesis